MSIYPYIFHNNTKSETTSYFWFLPSSQRFADIENMFLQVYIDLTKDQRVLEKSKARTKLFIRM